MKKALTASVAALTLVAAIASASTEANASKSGRALTAGIVGGLAVGAIVGSAASRPAYAYPAYAPAPGYVVYESYAAPYPVGCPGGYWARKPVAFNAYGQPIAWSKPKFICPAY